MAGLWQLAVSPAIGVRLRGDSGVVRLTHIEPHSRLAQAGLTNGTPVATVAGHPVTSAETRAEVEDCVSLRDHEAFWRWQRFAYERARQGHLELTIAGAPTRSFSLPVHSLGLGAALQRSLLLRLVAWGFLLVSFLIWARRPGEVGWIALSGGSGVFVCLVAMSTYGARDFCLQPTVFTALAALSYIGGSASLLCLHLGLVFPSPVTWLKRRAWLRWLPSLLALTLIVTHVFRLVFLPPQVIYSFWALSLFGFAATSLIRAHWSHDPLLRAQLLWVALGATMGFVPWVLLTVLPNAFGAASVPENYTMLCAVASPICLYLAIIRYRLLDIDRVFQWTVVHVVVLAVFSLFELFVWNWLDNRPLPSSARSVLVTSSMFVLVFLYAPLRDWMLRRLAMLSGRQLPSLAACLSRTMQRGSATRQPSEALTESLQWALNLERWQWLHSGEGYDAALQRLLAQPQGLLGYELGTDCPPGLETAGWLPVDTGREMTALALWPSSVRGWSRRELSFAASLIRACAPMFEIDEMHRNFERQQAMVRNEREELLREMHDGLGSQLFGASLMTDVSDELGEAMLRKRLRGVRSVLADAMDSMRTGLTVLSSPPGAFGPAVLSLLMRSEDVLEAAGIVLDTTVDDTATALQLDSRVSFGILRAMQAGLTNLALHSHATHAWVRIGVAQARLSICMEDNGVGFVLPEQNSGCGLSSMKMRMEMLGGQATIRTAPGQGCKVLFQVPLSRSGG